MTTKHAKLSSMQRVNAHYPAEKIAFSTKQCLGTQHNASGEARTCNPLVLSRALQVCSQTEARKRGLQHHKGLDARNNDFVAGEQQRHRPAQFDQRLCYSLSKK